MLPDPDGGAIAFAERLMTVLDEGRFTATYKYSVLLALTDLCLEYSTKSGSAPESVTTRQLAVKVLELYWPHTMPYEAAGTVLWQNSGRRQAGIVRAIQQFREKLSPDPSATLARARYVAPDPFARLIDEVEWKLIEMPLPRLQRVGTEANEFVYHIQWNESITRKRVRHRDFDNLIRFAASAGDHLIRLSGLLRPLIEREWTRLVAQFNRNAVPEIGLQEFLFGVDRINLSPVRNPLRELSENHCFYCADRLSKDFEVDHFIPWSRYPDNGIENLVVADRRCNNAKRNHLAAGQHLKHWIQRSQEKASDLGQIADQIHWDRHPGRSTSVARSVYLRLPVGSKLWNAPGDFALVDRNQLAGMFHGS